MACQSYKLISTILVRGPLRDGPAHVNSTREVETWRYCAALDIIYTMQHQLDALLLYRTSEDKKAPLCPSSRPSLAQRDFSMHTRVVQEHFYRNEGQCIGQRLPHRRASQVRHELS